MSLRGQEHASSQTLDSFSCREQRDEGGEVSVVEQDDEGGEAAAGEHEHPRPAAPCVLFRVGFLPALSSVRLTGKMTDADADLL